ncbi:hypothetical protein J6590_059889, partial [Homalodisca vitripennis]
TKCENTCYPTQADDKLKERTDVLLTARVKIIPQSITLPARLSSSLPTTEFVSVSSLLCRYQLQTIRLP